MAKVVLVVELEIKPDDFETFVDIVTRHAANTLRIEEDCLRFEVLKPRESKNKLMLVEMYSDDAALDRHWNSDHMAAYRQKVSEMIVSRIADRCDLV